MGSRIREKPERLFEVFMEVAKPDGQGEVPFVVQQFPENYEDKEALNMIPKFVFPCDSDASKVDHFSFVLTDVDSMFRFGYCRHATGHQTCLCIVSWLPWCEIFYKMLDLLAELTNRSELSQVQDFLQAAYDHEVPASKVPVTIVCNEEMFNFTAPDPNILPSIPGSRNLTEYYNAVDTANMMLIFASMLQERRVYMTSKKLSRLTSCVFAAEALLYPMHWQHIFIPVLPAYLIEYLSSPIPYVIGVHGNLIPKLIEHRVDVADAVVVDLDTNTVTTEHDDLANLPEDVTNSLKKDLKAETLRISMMKTGDAISMAFLKALVKLIGGYRDALKFRPGEPITFDPKAFVQSRPSQSTRAYLEGMLSLQIFMQFIHGRLEILNAGIGFRDIFEQQATFYTDKLNSQSRYEKWLEIAKKKSKNGFMGVKVKFIVQMGLTRNRKAAPMMSTAVNSLKEQSKRAMTKISGLTDPEEKKGSSFKPSGGVIHSKPKSRPESTIDGSEQKSAKPPRPPPPSGRHKKDSLNRPQSTALRNSINHDGDKEESHDDSQLRLSYHTMDMSLMGDSDIQAAMLRSASAEVLPSEGSMGSSSTPSSVSLEETDSANIPFSNLNSSDEGLNMLAPSDQDSVSQVSQDMCSKEDNLMVPVAPPRTKRKSPKSSPVASPLVSASRMRPTATSTPATTAPQIPGPPKPLPRQSSLHLAKGKQVDSRATATVQDAPLIKFDSSESGGTPDSDVFDPLALGKSKPEAVEGRSEGDEFLDSAFSSGFDNNLQGVDAEEGGESDGHKFQRNRDSRSSLTRAKAFRRESPAAPLRPSYKEDSPEHSSAKSTPKREPGHDLFDPLSGVGGLSMSDTSEMFKSSKGGATGTEEADHQEKEERRRKSSQLLLHEWSLDSLASMSKSPTVGLPSNPGRLRHQTTNPFLVGSQLTSQPAGGRSNLQVAQPTTTQPRHYHPHYSLAYAGSGPLPPPGRLPTSFLAPFSQNQPSMPLPANSSPAGIGTSSSSASPYNSPSYKPAPARPQSHNPSSNPFTHTPGRLLPAPSPSSTPARRTLPAAPGTGVSGPSATTASGSIPPATSSKTQADILSDLIGIDFGGGTQKSAQPYQNQQQQQQQQQQQTTRNSQAQHRWETFD